MKRFGYGCAVLGVLLTTLGCQSGGTSAGSRIQIAVTENGFEPSEISVKRGENVTLIFTRRTEQTCATEVIVADRDIQKDLPLNQAVSVDLGRVETGPVTFGCPMDMVRGEVVLRD